MQTPEYHNYPFGTVPKRLNDFFMLENREIVGRTGELADVRRHLLDGRNVVLVNGVGGIGKTTIARKYVELHWHDYQHVAWLTVASPQSLDYDLKRASEGHSALRDAFLRSPALWESLCISQQVQQYLENKDLNGAFKLVSQRIGHLKNCLIVLDNANEAEDLLENRPDLKSINAHVLVTSRAKPKEWQIVEVHELPLNEAKKLFRQHYDHPSLGEASEAEVNKLVETLLCHTLLLELVGKSAGLEGANIPFPKLLESLQNQSYHDQYLNRITVDAGDHADGQNLRRQATIEGYISLIFYQIGALVSMHRDLLKAMTLLPPAQAYSWDFLTEHCQLLDVEFSPERAEALVLLGWLKREALLKGGIGYSLHPLILDVAFLELKVKADWAEKVVQQAVELIYYESTNPEHNFREKRGNQPYADHLGKLFFDAETEQVSYLLDHLAILEEVYGFYKNAARLGERALSIAEMHLSEVIVATRQSNLAVFYKHLGDYIRARDLLEKALSLDEKNFEPYHPRIATRRSNLAVIYRNLGEYVRARDLLEKALLSDEKNFGPDHPTVAVSQSNLANVCIDLGEYVRARGLLEKALLSAEKNFGSDHPNMAIRYNNLASVFFAEKNYHGAIEAFQKALYILEKTLGQQHPYFQQFSKSLQAAQKAAAEST